MALRNKNFILLFLFTIFFTVKMKGNIIIMLMKFLKNACSKGWINCEQNLIIAAKTENKKQEKIRSNIENIFF